MHNQGVSDPRHEDLMIDFLGFPVHLKIHNFVVVGFPLGGCQMRPVMHPRSMLARTVVAGLHPQIPVAGMKPVG